MNTGYKVVSHDLKSYMHRWLGQYTIQYKIGEWVKSWPGTPLMYFADRNSLNKFLQVEDLNFDLYHVYTVQARYPFNHKYGYGIEAIKNYIKAAKQHKKYKPDNEFKLGMRMLTAGELAIGFANGTKFCKEIKLVQRIM